MNWSKVLLEAIISGIAVLVIGLIVNWLSQSWRKDHLLSIRPEFHMSRLGLNLFITGVLVYIIAEFSGANRWYCRNGNACLA